MLQIDLRGAVRPRMGRMARALVPGFLFGALERLIHQDELNDVLRATYPSTGAAFAEGVYRYFDLSLEVTGLDHLSGEGRYIFASNHPLGGLDGIGIVKALGTRWPDSRIRFLVNDMLMHVEPLRPVFLPVNKYGVQGRGAAAAIAEAYASDAQIALFPAGLVSRLGGDGAVRDLEWQKSFVVKAVEYRRDIVPVHFSGLNRPRFYKAARWRKKLRIPVNLEQALLPGEVCASRGSSFRVDFGEPVPWKETARLLTAGARPKDVAASFRDRLYAVE